MRAKALVPFEAGKSATVIVLLRVSTDTTVVATGITVVAIKAWPGRINSIPGNPATGTTLVIVLLTVEKSPRILIKELFPLATGVTELNLP